MKDDEYPKTVEELLDLLEKPTVEYVQRMMKELGIPMNKEKAENVIANLGKHISNKKTARALQAKQQ